MGPGESQSLKQPHAGCSSSPQGAALGGVPVGEGACSGEPQVPGRCQLRWPMAPHPLTSAWAWHLWEGRGGLGYAPCAPSLPPSSPRACFRSGDQVSVPSSSGLAAGEVKVSVCHGVGGCGCRAEVLWVPSAEGSSTDLPLCSLASCPEPSQALVLPTIMDNYQQLDPEPAGRRAGPSCPSCRGLCLTGGLPAASHSEGTGVHSQGSRGEGPRPQVQLQADL